MKLSSIKSLTELRKFIESNEFLYDEKGEKYRCKELMFRVNSVNERFIASYWEEKFPICELFDEKSYLKYKKEKEKAEKELSSVFSEV